MPIGRVHVSVATCDSRGVVCCQNAEREVASGVELSLADASNSAGYHMIISIISSSQPCPAVTAARCGQILLLFRLRSEAAPRRFFPADYPPRRVPLLMTTHTELPEQRAPISLLSPASPDPEPQTLITACLGCVCFAVHPKLGCNLHDADAGQLANPANQD